MPPQNLLIFNSKYFKKLRFQRRFWSGDGHICWLQKSAFLPLLLKKFKRARPIIQLPRLKGGNKTRHVSGRILLVVFCLHFNIMYQSRSFFVRSTNLYSQTETFAGLLLAFCWPGLKNELQALFEILDLSR